jgi:Uncharacterized protein conserved in bacteria
MDKHQIVDYIQNNFQGVESSENFGYDFFFYGSDHTLPFVTIANSDNEYDSYSKLNTPDRFRLNIGVSRESFKRLIGSDKPEIGSYDFSQSDTIMPHPEYAAQSWICVVKPSERLFEEELKPLIQEAYDLAVQRAKRRQKASE